MKFQARTWPEAEFAEQAAEEIAARFPEEGAVVLTGGTTAEKVFAALAEVPSSWEGIDVFFSDERCVPPDDPRSNFGMVQRTLLRAVAPRRVLRMHGEERPDAAAREYDNQLRRAPPLELAILGMGADAHIAALFPGSPATDEAERLCVAVERPDDLQGLTLTPPALLAAAEILLIVSGEAKAEAVRRAFKTDEPPASCPVLVLADHDAVTFLLDDAAAGRLPI